MITVRGPHTALNHGRTPGPQSHRPRKTPLGRVAKPHHLVALQKRRYNCDTCCYVSDCKKDTLCLFCLCLVWILLISACLCVCFLDTVRHEVRSRKLPVHPVSVQSDNRLHDYVSCISKSLESWIIYISVSTQVFLPTTTSYSMSSFLPTINPYIIRIFHT